MIWVHSLQPSENTLNGSNNGSSHLKLEHIVVYENSWDEFDIGHCQIKVKVTALL